jgi:hypothetical protein
MFAWREKRDFDSQLKRVSSSSSTKSGANRRAIGLMPLPTQEDGREVAQSDAVRYHEMLVSIEGKQSTCCLRIISPRRRSRAAILIFRGRVLGCIYGNKSLGQQLMGHEAHRHAMNDLAFPDNIIDAYDLAEELVLATASMFHGVVLEPSSEFNNEERFEWCIQALLDSDNAGCVVISTQDNLSVCMVYTYRGKIVGVYSYRDGWVSSSYEAGLKYVLETVNSGISASMLPLTSAEEIMQLTFSLSGLADRAQQEWLQKESGPLYAADIQGESVRTTWQLQQLQKPMHQYAPAFNEQRRSTHWTPPSNRSHSHLIKP